MIETLKRLASSGRIWLAQNDQLFLRLFRAVEVAYKPIFNMLEARKAKNCGGHRQRRENQGATRQTEAARQQLWPRPANWRTRSSPHAREAAARVTEAESQKAIAAAEQIIAKAREAAAQERAATLAELKREVGRLVVRTTMTVTGKVLTPEDQRRLAEETQKQIV